MISGWDFPSNPSYRTRRPSSLQDSLDPALALRQPWEQLLRQDVQHLSFRTTRPSSIASRGAYNMEIGKAINHFGLALQIIGWLLKYLHVGAITWDTT